MSKIYADGAVTIDTGIPEAVGIEINIVPQNLKKEIHFYENDLVKGNYLFRKFILKPDIQKELGYMKKIADFPLVRHSKTTQCADIKCSTITLKRQ